MTFISLAAYAPPFAGPQCSRSLTCAMVCYVMFIVLSNEYNSSLLDSTQAASIYLRRYLMKGPVTRVKPLKYNERNMTIVKPEENILQSELDGFDKWTVDNKLLVDSKKCFVMKFSRSKLYDFPPETLF